MLVNEEGSGEIFVRLRKYAGVYYDEYSQKQTTGWIGDLFSCIWCMSVWVSFILVHLYKWRVSRNVIITPLAISALAIVIHKHLIKEDR